MKSENKYYRVIFLAIGLVIYYIFFCKYWDGGFFYFEIDFEYSFVGGLVSNFLGEFLYGMNDYLFWFIEKIIIFGFNAFYLITLWVHREDFVVLTKKFIKKI